MAKIKSDTAVGKISKSEIHWVTAYDIHHELQYIITSNKDRSTYYIYDKNYKKLGSSKSPAILEEKYFG